MGLTCWLPEAETVPTPPLIVTSFAFVVVQRSVADCPASIRLGSAVSVAVGKPGGFAAGSLDPCGAADGCVGGGVGICFIPHALANSVIAATAVTASVRLRSRNEKLFIVYFTPQTGYLLVPCVVNCVTCVPSASM